MEILSQTIQYKGNVFKIEGERIFARTFGTTIYNHKMHWNWIEIGSDTSLYKAIKELLTKTKEG